MNGLCPYLPMTKPDTSGLDDMQDAFQANPSSKAAANYLREALTYWQDDMIEDSEISDILEEVIAWLERK